jgi:hypothetical protein
MVFSEWIVLDAADFSLVDPNDLDETLITSAPSLRLV